MIKSEKKEIVLLELFSGTGGFAKGISDAGYKIKKHYFSEVNRPAIANYKYNFKDSIYVGSVTDVRGNSIERPDIITFGSPCQDFSLAGKRAGLDGKRSSLIMEAIRLISETKPSVFVWENVKGSFSSNNGADFWAIIAAFADIGGYRLEWQLCNTSWFLPQNRERIYLVGHLAGRSELGVFPFSKNDRLFNGKKRKKQIDSVLRDVFADLPDTASCITGGGHSGGLHSDMDFIKLKEKDYSRGNSQGVRVYDVSGLSVTLSALGGGCGAKTGLYEIKSNTKKGYDVVSEGDSINFSNPNSKTRRGRVGVVNTLDTMCNQAVVKPVITPNRVDKQQNGRRFKKNGDDAYTISCQDSHGVQINDSIRRLTEIECERLQGFSDNWTMFGLFLKPSVQKYVFSNKKKWRTEKARDKLFVYAVNNTTLIEKEISRTQRYKMCGNAVTTDFPREISKRLKFN
ncbi:DNA (cytosine-5-)-methyltransferase [uncultured Flavobacterium sp.]|uniref:DNA cytosine methyltransferase n=1 Tax=uncultured Flavobacterium sp. TaxID=165435 RepID=UPI0025CE3172|nr:DNA (cytosine-5-)-methyltransferase [uncultured Flavobacterium sp.]